MVEFQAARGSSWLENCGRGEPAFSFPLGAHNLGGLPLGQLAAGVEMEAIYSGNSDRTTIKSLGNPDSSLLTTIKMAWAPLPAGGPGSDPLSPPIPTLEFCQKIHLSFNCRRIHRKLSRHSSHSFFLKWSLCGCILIWEPVFKLRFICLSVMSHFLYMFCISLGNIATFCIFMSSHGNRNN